jgi:hypothetical protein
MGSNDGTPSEVLRFQRDTLGCSVLCLTDHVEYMNAGEFTRVMDRLEAQEDESHVPIYGVEWAGGPAHDTNFLAVDRSTMDRLRIPLLVHRDLRTLYVTIRRDFPASSVTAVRHMHGRSDSEFGISGSRMAETFDPEVEWAMEAMQTRGNFLLDHGIGGIPRFPNSFLDAGCSVGVVGGSDHSRGAGVNPFCLTGFWVRELSAAGVFEALRARKTICSAGGKIALQATLDGAALGEEVTTSPPVAIRAHASSALGVRQMVLLRDGEPVARRDVDGQITRTELLDGHPPRGRHWYCITAAGPGRNPESSVLAHTSPLFVTVG